MMKSVRVAESQSQYISHLYRQVENTAELRSKIFSEGLPIVLLQPKLIVDDFQVQMAIMKALYNLNENRMKTKTLQTEIIYCLSPSKNITDSLKSFSSTDQDTDILIVGQDLEFNTFKGIIKGEEVPLAQLTELTDVKNIMDMYKITSEELGKSTLVNSIISRMAAKEYYSVTSSTD